MKILAVVMIMMNNNENTNNFSFLRSKMGHVIKTGEYYSHLQYEEDNIGIDDELANKIWRANVKRLDQVINILRSIIEVSPSDLHAKLNGPLAILVEQANYEPRKYLLDVSNPSCREYAGWFLNESPKGAYILKIKDRVMTIQRFIRRGSERPFATYILNVNGNIEICINEIMSKVIGEEDGLFIDIKNDNTEVLDLLQSPHYTGITDVHFGFYSRKHDPTLQYRIWSAILGSWTGLRTLKTCARDIVGEIKESVVMDQLSIQTQLMYNDKIAFYGNNVERLNVSTIDKDGNLSEVVIENNLPRMMGSKSLKSLEIDWDIVYDGVSLMSIIHFILRQTNLKDLIINFFNRENIDFINNGTIKGRMIHEFHQTTIDSIQFKQQPCKKNEIWSRDYVIKKLVLEVSEPYK
jgi:hypothetical protein